MEILGANSFTSAHTSNAVTSAQAPADLTASPGPPQADRPAWTIVSRPCSLEVVEHMLGAVSCPDAEEVVVIVTEAAAAIAEYAPRRSAAAQQII